VILETQFEPKRNKDFKKFLEQIGIDPNDKMTVLNGIMAVFAGKALDGDIVAAKFLLDVAGYSLSAKERLAKIKLLERMANPEDAEALAKVKPPINLDEIDEEARKLGIYDG